jgi:hypothetical protein
LSDSALIFVTLGPTGTDHENALVHYLDFQHLSDARIELVDDLLDGLERVRGLERGFLVQAGAHGAVDAVMERYWREIFVVDAFIYPTKPMAVLRRVGVDSPKSIGLMPATAGYLDLSPYEQVVYEVSKPIVGRQLLAGAYDVGLTHAEWADVHADELEIHEWIGCVDNAWLVFGRRRRCDGRLIGQRCPSLFTP